LVSRLSKAITEPAKLIALEKKTVARGQNHLPYDFYFYLSLVWKIHHWDFTWRDVVAENSISKADRGALI
jgi:hypothetical protein